MPDVKQFKLPDVGEGLTEADILSWSVAVGDTVVVNQTLVEVETAKAAVELPSPFAGTVTALHAEAGQTVEVGAPIISIDTGAGTVDTSTDTDPATDAAAPAPDVAVPAEGERQAVLVGYGPRSGPTARRARRTAHVSAVADAPVPTAQSAFSHTPPPEPAPAALVTVPTAAPGGPGARAGALAKPPVRKLARQLGVDLAGLTGTGPNGSVSRDDVERASGADDADRASGGSAPTPAGPRETRIPIKGVRKHTAAAMVASAFTAPHVTEFVTCDVSATMDLRRRIADRRDFAGVKVSPMLLVARALLWAVTRTPIVNARWDEAAGEIVMRDYVNLGIAAATDRGLIVPNVKDADRLSLRELADAFASLTETARSGRTLPADMAGGTITITNVGVFGVDTGTPILNPGESAILALGAVRRAPWVVERDGVETLEPRWVAQLALSFDHRLVDGEQGSIFLADIAAILTDPGLALL